MRTRLVALLLAVVLGAGGGVTTALLGDDGGGGGSAAKPYADPLGLRIPKVDLGCTGEPVMVVGFGDNAAALRNEVVNTPGEDLRYLDTRRSCETRWTPASSDADPRWVAYLPGDPTELCLARLSDPVHRRDNVTFLVDGVDERAMCLCEVPAAEAPELAVDRPAATDDRKRIWIGELQDVLIHIDEGRSLDPTNPEDVLMTDADRTGVYDERTAARIDQVRHKADLEMDGVLDERVWQRITAAGCPLYNYR